MNNDQLNDSEREELTRLREEESQRQNEEFCERWGHTWFREPYVGCGGSNYLTCERCGRVERD